MIYNAFIKCKFLLLYGHSWPAHLPNLHLASSSFSLCLLDLFMIFQSRFSFVLFTPIQVSDLNACPIRLRFPLLFTFSSLSLSASCSSSWQISPFSPPSVSLSDHIFEQAVINDIQRLMNYSLKKDRKYRERKKGNSEREDEKGGWGGRRRRAQERKGRQMIKVMQDEDGKQCLPVTY